MRRLNENERRALAACAGLEPRVPYRPIPALAEFVETIHDVERLEERDEIRNNAAPPAPGRS